MVLYFSEEMKKQGSNYLFGSDSLKFSNQFWQLRSMWEHCQLLHWGLEGEAPKDFGQNAI